MDPAGIKACAPSRHDLDEFQSPNHCTSDLEARKGTLEYLSPESGPDCGLQPTEADPREEQLAEEERKSKDQYGWRRVIRNFTPSYAKAFHSTPAYKSSGRWYGSSHS